uniref:Uncharacterized protein n=1 Tax=Amblyomma americanum TaxID=6943 RepID=A0A0C9SDK9_AMBAM
MSSHFSYCSCSVGGHWRLCCTSFLFFFLSFVEQIEARTSSIMLCPVKRKKSTKFTLEGMSIVHICLSFNLSSQPWTRGATSVAARNECYTLKQRLLLHGWEEPVPLLTEGAYICYIILFVILYSNGLYGILVKGR